MAPWEIENSLLWVKARGASTHGKPYPITLNIRTNLKRKLNTYKGFYQKAVTTLSFGIPRTSDK